MTAEPGRVWGGLTTQERVDRRRRQFLDAGLEVFATDGWAGATVLRICRTARLSQRYFYEHFDSREALFLALMDELSEQVEAVVREAAATPGRTPRERVGEVLSALATHFAADPRAVRIALVESFATEPFRARRAQLLAFFAQLASRLMLSLSADPARVDRRSIQLSAVVLSGGIAEVLVSALSGHGEPAPDELIAHLTRLYTVATDLADG